MSSAETERARIAELRALLERANVAYYADNDPFMADSVFDALLAELAALEAKHPDLADPESPTQRIGGAPIQGFESAEHTVPMRSIDNTYSIDDLRAWYRRCAEALGHDPALTCDPKIDGVAVSLRYELGVLRTALTRGDGTKGDLITSNARVIRSIPLRLRQPPHRHIPEVLEVRGEIFMPTSAFDRING